MGFIEDAIDKIVVMLSNFAKGNGNDALCNELQNGNINLHRLKEIASEIGYSDTAYSQLFENAANVSRIERYGDLGQNQVYLLELLDKFEKDEDKFRFLSEVSHIASKMQLELREPPA